MSEEAWVARARDALARPEPDRGDDVEVVRGARRALFDVAALRSLISIALAIAAWWVAMLRAQGGDAPTAAPIDAIALLVELVALALSARAAVAMVELARRWRIWLSAARHALVMTPEGLLLRTPQGDAAVDRSDVVAVVERGEWGTRAGERWREVYVVTRSSSRRAFVTLPPVLGDTPGVLAEQLMRWLARTAVCEADDTDTDKATERSAEAPSPALVSVVYEQAVAGRAPPEVTVIRHGAGWLRRGPYASALMAIVVAHGFLQMPRASWIIAAPLAAVSIAICLGLPLMWLVRARSEIAPRRGVALVLTPTDALMRTRSGVLRIPWSDVGRLTVNARGTWSLFDGYSPARELVFVRRDGSAVRYQEAFLGAPVEVAKALCDHYRASATR